jgi:triosephosphate isomerase
LVIRIWIIDWSLGFGHWELKYMPRKPLIVGNWKMELSHKAALELTRALKKLLHSSEVTSDLVICPSFPSLSEVAESVKNVEYLQVGAQNVHWEEKGAWTGEVSISQISPFIKWCIIGHSEQRRFTDETDEVVARKATLLLTHGVTPIVCIGETAEEHAADATVAKITAQINSLVSTMTRSALSKLVITYEPIWAISANHPGQLPDPTDIAEDIMLIRKIIAARFDQEAAERLRILYGGSVNGENVGSYASEPGVDGVLVGNASLHPLQFIEIIKQVQSAAE